MKQIVRCAMALVGLVFVASTQPALAWCIWGFGQCEKNSVAATPIAGEYTLDRNPSTSLTITGNKITSKTGPVSFSADYVVKLVDGKNLTIEVGPPEPKETVQVQIEKDHIKVRNSQLFAGDWKKTTGR